MAKKHDVDLVRIIARASVIKTIAICVVILGGLITVCVTAYKMTDKPPWLVGNFLEGFGFMSVHFPKVECREMTDKEKREHENGRTAIIPMSEVFEVRHVPTDRDVSDFIGRCVEEFGGEPS